MILLSVKLVFCLFSQFFILSTNTGTTENAEADLIIGADGAHSKVRKIMTRRPLFNCAQTYIEHGYVELSVSRSEDNEVSMKKKYI